MQLTVCFTALLGGDRPHRTLEELTALIVEDLSTAVGEHVHVNPDEPPPRFSFGLILDSGVGSLAPVSLQDGGWASCVLVLTPVGQRQTSAVQGLVLKVLKRLAGEVTLTHVDRIKPSS